MPGKNRSGVHEHKGEPIIRLENVWKIYKMGKVNVPALRGVDLEVRRGEFIAIMGPSGSGKSTLMNMLGALDVPTRGRILLEGNDIAKMGESSLAQLRGRKVGFVFQQFNLIQTLTAMGNVALPMLFQGVPERERAARAKELLRMFGLGDRLHHKPTEMSGGEQQRVSIARALANDPDIILADEPTGNLDSKTGKQIMDAIRKLHESSMKTILMVTHDPYIAGRAERLVNIMDGRILKDHEASRKFLWKTNGGSNED
ncbi:MAG: ABC transporter ATP-binding protein [Candidatus Aenigmatarchaeota archaeon]